MITVLVSYLSIDGRSGTWRLNVTWLCLTVILLLSWPSSARQTQGGAPPEGICTPLPPPSGNTIEVSTVTQLQSAVNAASSGTTILVADGVYNLNGVYLQFDVPNVTLRSASGDREAVVLDGNYVTTEIVQIVASDVTIADLTLREAYYHPIHVMSTTGGPTNGTFIYNVHIIDPREQAIKINPGYLSSYYVDDGVVACSHIELTDAGRPHVNPTAGGCYTGGVDAHQAQGWVIRDNLIEGFWCPNGLSEHGVHFWRSCRGTIVERNVLRDNARGIGFGLAQEGDGGERTYPGACPSAGGGYVDHYDGVIRNNFVFASRGELFASQYGFDCGICLWQACGAWVLHNTVASTQVPFSSIEWFWDRTDVDVVNNLVTHNLRDRGGTARLSGNLDYQPLFLFVDGSDGDLHLLEDAVEAIDGGVAVAAGLCDDDVDGDGRPIGSGRDVGADEYGFPPLAAVTDLRVTEAITDGSTLTATLRWSASAGAVTTTLRYSNTRVTVDNWADAILLTDALSGSAEIHTAMLLYDGGTAYFALKSQNGEGDWSGLSNNAFWPAFDVYLPLILRNF